MKDDFIFDEDKFNDEDLSSLVGSIGAIPFEFDEQEETIFESIDLISKRGMI